MSKILNLYCRENSILQGWRQSEYLYYLNEINYENQMDERPGYYSISDIYNVLVEILLRLSFKQDYQTIHDKYFMQELVI